VISRCALENCKREVDAYCRFWMRINDNIVAAQAIACCFAAPMSCVRCCPVRNAADQGM
jgi:hypothetical protein